MVMGVTNGALCFRSLLPTWAGIHWNCVEDQVEILNGAKGIRFGVTKKRENSPAAWYAVASLLSSVPRNSTAFAVLVLIVWDRFV